MTVYEYSGIENGQTLLITPSEQSVSVVLNGSDQKLASQSDCTSDAIPLEEDYRAPNDYDDINPDDVDEYLEIMIDVGERIEEGDIDIKELPATTHNVIDPAVYFGPLTGVKIATHGQIRQRTRRWNRTSEASTTIGSSDADLSARDAVSYAVLRTLEMQRISDLTMRNSRTVSLVTDAIGDNIISHRFKSG